MRLIADCLKKPVKALRHGQGIRENLFPGFASRAFQFQSLDPIISSTASGPGIQVLLSVALTSLEYIPIPLSVAPPKMASGVHATGLTRT